MKQLIELKYGRFRLSDDEFYDFFTQNDSLKFERDAHGNIFIIPNTGGTTEIMNSEINFEFVGWNRQSKLGKVFDSSTTFRLPITAAHSADVAWVNNDSSLFFKIANIKIFDKLTLQNFPKAFQLSGNSPTTYSPLLPPFWYYPRRGGRLVY